MIPLPDVTNLFRDAELPTMESGSMIEVSEARDHIFAVESIVVHGNHANAVRNDIHYAHLECIELDTHAIY